METADNFSFKRQKLLVFFFNISVSCQINQTKIMNFLLSLRKVSFYAKYSMDKNSEVDVCFSQREICHSVKVNNHHWS